MAAKKTKSRRGEPKYEISSGNVFADLGLPNAEDRMTKAKLARQISILIEAAGLNQAKAAERLGIDQPRVSNLLRGRLALFSTERLMHFLTLLDQEIIVTVRPRRRGHKPGLRVLVEA
jgi:predicted XRE-type DNA-binding protein